MSEPTPPGSKTKWSPQEVQDLLPIRAARRPLLGLDLGTKTIGLALSDIDWRIASPLETIKRGKFTGDAERLLAVCADHQIGALVIGWPLNMNGSVGPRAQATKSFARNLAQLTSLPLALWDERLSTAAAHRPLIDADLSRARRAQIVDKIAAAFILQGALDFLMRQAH